MPRIKGWKKVDEDEWVNTNPTSSSSVQRIRIDYLPGRRRFPYEVYIISARASAVYGSFEEYEHARKQAILFMKQNPNG